MSSDLDRTTPGQGRRLCAVRGATSVEADTADAIAAATTTLLTEMMERNGVERDDLVSIFFTSTADLRSEFPAVAARSMGLSEVPLMCAQEVSVGGALPRCVRVLLHLYTAREYADLRPVYLGRASALRTDLDDRDPVEDK